MLSVDFLTNCYERDYREVLSAGFVRRMVEPMQFAFRRIIVVINNVDDRAHATGLADAAVARGDIDRYAIVEDLLPQSLETCGLSLDDLGSVKCFTDFLLVTATCTDADYIVHFDPDVFLLGAYDWVSPGIEKLQSDSGLLVVNPVWSGPRAAEDLRAETQRLEPPYHIGFGFSDQCFLAERARLAQPIYREKNVSGLRYPMAFAGDTFEKRVDAYMRNHGLRRATDATVAYVHRGAEGLSYVSLPLHKRAFSKVVGALHRLLAR